MNDLSLKAKVLILGTVLVGFSLFARRVSTVDQLDLSLLATLSILASLSLIFKVLGATRNSHYNLSFLVYAFTFVLMGVQAAFVVILISNLVEWVYHRYVWYIQLFNIGTYFVAFAAAGIVHEVVLGPLEILNLVGVADILVTMAVFTFINHLMIGLALWLARGVTFAQSGVFDTLTIMIDYTMLVMGGGAALVWTFNPYAIVVILIPLYLIYSTLKVPALERKTETDPKTGLYNARHFTDALASELTRAERFNRPLSVIMADLDLLRNINNSYGHLAGDAVIVGIAGILQTSARDYDVVARFGGEEFAILLPETTLEQAVVLAENIRQTIERTAFTVSTSVEPIRATMSFGVAQRNDQRQSADDLVHKADLAAYQAKQDGRNRTRAYNGNDNVQQILQSMNDAFQHEGGPERVLATPEHYKVVANPGETPAEPAYRPEPSRSTASYPRWYANAFIGGVTFVAALLALLLVPHTPAIDWYGLILFMVVALLAEALQIEVYVKDTAVSTSVAPLVAGSLLFGPIGAVALALAAAVAAIIKNRSPLSRFLFNLSNFMIGNMLSAILILLVGAPVSAWPLPIQIVLALIACGLVYLSTTSLLAGVITLSSGQSVQYIWSERFRWLAPYYLALSVVAFALVFSYFAAGLIGVLVILVPLMMLRFSQKQYLEHTKAVVNQLRAINSELLQQTQEVGLLNEELLLALAQATDLRDPDVYAHSENVARYAVLTATELNLPAERIELVQKSGLLHDIGKLGIPETILFKPAKLTIHEYEQIKEHVTIGANLLGAFHSLQNLIPFVLHHHEHYDGQGYPFGLTGEAIPLEARILGLADAVEAMASDRPYRRGQPAQAILKEIHRCAGTQFDPIVVDAFTRVLERYGESVIVNSARKLHQPDSFTKQGANGNGRAPKVPAV